MLLSAIGLAAQGESGSRGAEETRDALFSHRSAPVRRGAQMLTDITGSHDISRGVCSCAEAGTNHSAALPGPRLLPLRAPDAQPLP